MSDKAPDQEQLQFQIQSLEMETKRLELEIKHEELRAQREGKRRLMISPVWIPLIAALFAVFGTLGSTFVQARDQAQAEALDRRKFELSVVEEAFKGVPPRQAALRVLVMSHLGYIHLTGNQEARLIDFAQRNQTVPEYLREAVTEGAGSVPAPVASIPAPGPQSPPGQRSPGPAAAPGTGTKPDGTDPK